MGDVYMFMYDVDQKQYKLREPPREQYLTSGAEE